MEGLNFTVEEIRQLMESFNKNNMGKLKISKRSEERRVGKEC